MEIETAACPYPEPDASNQHSPHYFPKIRSNMYDILTTWNRTVLEKLIVTQLAKKSPLLWNPKVRHRFQNSPSLVPILRQINPVYTSAPYFLKIHFKIIFEVTHSSSEWSLPFKLSDQKFCMQFFSLPCVQHGPPIFRLDLISMITFGAPYSDKVTLPMNS